ncbi:MAG: carboxypeptidase regulatory-like domain-containing protein [Planctomycetota bacterium]|jgi:protocatechuate 3,4-dioxygenase beta subunit
MAEPGSWKRVLLWLGVIVALASLSLLIRSRPEELAKPERGGSAPAEESSTQASRQQAREPLARASTEEDETAAAPEGIAGAELVGRVLDALGSPLPGCRVIIDPREAVRFATGEYGEQSAAAEDLSDSGGRFELLADGPGPWILTLIHRDYPPTVAESNLMLSSGQRTQLGDLRLHSEIGLVVMVRAEGGLPVPGALLTLNPVLENPELPSSTQRAMRRTALTDQTGRALFYGVDAGPYLLRAEASGLASTEQAHMQEAGLARPPRKRIDLERGEVLRGRVRDAGGEPVSGARILVQGQDHAWTDRTKSATGGLFRITGLRRGSYSLRAEAPWLGSTLLDEVQIPFSLGLVDLQFPPQIAVTGRVLRADSQQPLAAATVELIAAAEWSLQMGGDRRRKATSDAEGAFRFESIPAGRYGLRVASNGFFPARTSIDIDDSSQPFTIALLEAFELRGRLIDESGLGLSGGAIQVVDASYDGSQFAEFKLQALARNAPLARFHSDPDGSFKSTALGSGEFRVRLSARGKADRLSRTFRAKPGESLDLGQLTLSPAARLQGRALLAMDAAAAQAVVCLDPLGDSEPPRLSHQVRADAAGNFLFEGIEAGRYELFYYYPEEQRPSPAVDSQTRSLVRIDIRAGALERQDLVLR